MNQKYVNEVISTEDLKYAESIVNNEKRKMQELVLKISKGRMENQQIINDILELDVGAGIESLLSSEVVNQ